jgi:GDP-D-mannose 3', 5'-epimerase
LNPQDKQNCHQVAEGASAVFQLADDMGGMGFIENNRARCMLGVFMNTRMLMAAKGFRVKRFLFSSSTCA